MILRTQTEKEDEEKSMQVIFTFFIHPFHGVRLIGREFAYLTDFCGQVLIRHAGLQGDDHDVAEINKAGNWV